MLDLEKTPTTAAAPAPWLSRKRLFQIHGWLGMTFGSLLFVICFSGAAAALSREIDWALNPSLRAFPTGAPQLSWQQWGEAAQAAQPDWKIRWIEKPFNPYAAVEVVSDAPSGLWRRTYIHPETGRVQGYSSYFNVQRFLRDFHRLLNIFSFGLFLVSGLGLALLFAIISGFLFYKNWWRNLFQLRLRKGLHAFSSDLHRLLGTWAFLFAALIAVTGFWYFYEYAGATLAPASSPKPFTLSNDQLAAHGPTAKLAGPGQYAAAAQQAYPELNIVSIHYPLTNKSPVLVYGQARAWFVRDRSNTVSLDPYTAKVLRVQRAEELSPLDRLTDSVDPLHFGDFGGFPTKLIWSVLGMALPIMILSGAYLSIRQSKAAPEWFRFRQWTWGTWASLLVFGYSLYCCVPAATRYRTPAIPAFTDQGTIEVGPWRGKLQAAARTVRVFLPDSNLKAVAISTNGSAKPQPLKLRAWAYESTAFDLPPNYDGQLLLTLEDWSGAKHHAKVSLSAAAFRREATVVPDEGQFTGVGAWFFLVPFMLVLSGCFFIFTARLGHWRL